MRLPKPANADTEEVPKAADLSVPHTPLLLAGDKKSLAIALVVSAAFLLAAAAIAAWLFMQKSVDPAVVNHLDPNSTVNVTSVAWVSPKLPDSFRAYDQSTHSAKVVYYPNESTGCSIATGVTAVTEDADLAKVAAGVGDDTNVTAKNVADGETGITVNDIDGQRMYDFTQSQFNQETTSPVASDKKLAGAVYYKEFGYKLASVGFVCKSPTLAANKDGLEELIKQFTVKTERQL